MKKFITLIFVLLSNTLAAQLRTTNDLSLVKEIEVKQFIGKRFRAGADIRSLPTDSIGLAKFFVLQVGKGDYDFVPGSARSKKATTIDTNWHSYRIEGTIAATAHKIWLYVDTRGNGNFHYDNFSLEIEQEPNVWSKLSIINADFEAQLPLKGFRGTESLKDKPGVSVLLGKDNDPKYLQYLYVRSTGAKPFYTYGRNDSTGKYAEVGKEKIYYEIYGKGPPLLLLHGNGGSISAFKEQIAAFAQHYRVIAVDTRGQGKSMDGTSEKFSYEQFAEDMKTLLDTLNLKSVNLLGWSDGGDTGLILAMKHPSYVKKLVVMGANLDPKETSVSPKILKQTRSDLSRLKSKNDPANRIGIMLMELLLSEPNIPIASLAQITARTLVLAGERDIILESHTRSIAAGIAGAELKILKGQTHYSPQENHVLFNKVVLDFLGRQ